MKKFIHIFAGTIALAIVSCGNNESVVIDPEVENIIYANIDNSDNFSRTSVDPTEYEGGHVGILWNPGDALGVYGGDVKNARFVCTVDAPAGRAAFSGSCGSPQYAYYPYSEKNDAADISSLIGTLPSVQVFDSSTGKIEGDYKFGKPRENSPEEFDFTHIFSLFRFNLEATGTPLVGDRLKSVTLELPQERKLAGDFTFSAIDGSYTFTGNTSSIVTVEWSDTPEMTANGICRAYMSAAPDLHTDDAVKVTVVTDRHKAFFNASISYDFVSNSVYTFSLRLTDYADLTVEEVREEPAEETANCYMVTTAGVHDFNATVIGNGQKGIIPGAGFHTDNASISPRSVRLLWQDVKGFVADVELKDGRVYYTTTGNVGNAVIAVYSEPEAKGDILWSWHIWGVGDALPADVELTNLNGNKFTIMSRNLGDRSDKSGYGVLYQWGRKDPVSSDSIIFVDNTEVVLDDPDTRRYSRLDRLEQVDSENATIEFSVRNPMRLVTINGGDCADDWLCKENLYLWGNTYFADGQASDETGFSDVKTIYDPSPVGYRVANCRTFSFFCKNETGSNGSSVNSARLDQLNYVRFDNGYFFKADGNDTEGVWFPQNGRRDGYYLPVTTYSGTGTKRIYYTSVGRYADCWYSNPASPNSGARRALRMSTSSYVENNNSNVANSYNKLNVYDFMKRSSALGVRCVREK